MGIEDAIEFFIGKIEAQASLEGCNLDSEQLKMLRMDGDAVDESETLTAWEEKFIEKYSPENEAQVWEDRMAALLGRAFEREMESARLFERTTEVLEQFNEPALALSRSERMYIIEDVIHRDLRARLKAQQTPWFLRWFRGSSGSK